MEHAPPVVRESKYSDLSRYIFRGATRGADAVEFGVLIMTAKFIVEKGVNSPKRLIITGLLFGWTTLWMRQCITNTNLVQTDIFNKEGNERKKKYLRSLLLMRSAIIAAGTFGTTFAFVRAFDISKSRFHGTLLIPPLLQLIMRASKAEMKNRDQEHLRWKTYAGHWILLTEKKQNQAL